MSSIEAPENLRWVIIYRENDTDPWKVHRHHGGTAFHFRALESCSLPVRHLRNKGQAFAVREDRVEKEYGVIL